eukprot:g25572.t1
MTMTTAPLAPIATANFLEQLGLWEEAKSVRHRVQSRPQARRHSRHCRVSAKMIQKVKAPKLEVKEELKVKPEIKVKEELEEKLAKDLMFLVFLKTLCGTEIL